MAALWQGAVAQPDWLVALVGAAVLLLLYAALFGRSARQVVVRTALVAAPVGLIGFAGLDVLFGFVGPDGEPGPIDTLIIQALIAGGFIALGWLVSFAVQEYRRVATVLKAERDVLVALREDVRDFLYAASRNDLRELEKRDTLLILGAPLAAPYQPFIPSVELSTVYRALAEQLPLVPEPPLGDVIFFYKQLSDVVAFTADLQGESYRSLPPDRRARAYRGYVQMRLTLQRRGVAAIEPINAKFEKDRAAGIPDLPSLCDDRDLPVSN